MKIIARASPILPKATVSAYIKIVKTRLVTEHANQYKTGCGH